MSSKYSQCDATCRVAYRDVVWVGVLQLNAGTLEHRAAEYSSRGLAAYVILGAGENGVGNVAEYATC